MRFVDCADCGSMMILRPDKYRPDRKFFRCINFPRCRGNHRTHPNGQPLGIPGDAKTRKLRRDGHRLAQLIWPTNTAKRLEYWLRDHGERDHFAQMDAKEARITIERLERRLYKRITAECIQNGCQGDHDFFCHTLNIYAHRIGEIWTKRLTL